MKESSKYLEKDCMRQREYYAKIKDFSEEELKKRRKAARLRVKKHRQSLKEASSLIETITDMPFTSSSNQSTPLIV